MVVRRYPVLFFDDEFHRLETFETGLVVAIAHTDQLVSIFGEQLLGSVLAGQQGGFDVRIVSDT